MIENPFSVGDAVLALRDEGGPHEEAKVVDAYSLIMGGDEQAMVCVEFSDGQRVYLRSDSPDVLPLPESGDADAPLGNEDPGS
jgi:hypothetical protein